MKVALFPSTKYEMFFSMDLYVQTINKVSVLIDTSAGPKLINRSFVHPTGALCAKPQNIRKPESAEC